MTIRQRLQKILSVLPSPLRKLVVLVVGGTVLLIGVVMIVLPGPASLIIPFGLAILSLEFVWAGVLLKRAKTMTYNAAVRVGIAKPKKDDPKGTAG